MRHISTAFSTAIIALTLFGAPDVLAEDSLDLTQYEGKVVVLDFWASWCAPCRRSFPWWNTMHAKYADEGLVIIGVNLDNDPNSAKEFLAEFPADFKIYYDTDKELARKFGVQAMPSSDQSSYALPSQSLSRPSQISNEGVISPAHVPHEPLVHV